MNRRLRIGIVGALTALCVADGAFAAEPKQKPPYYASIAPARARMRSGPGRTYPATWLYVRRDLPVRVIDTFKEWRKVEDPSGTQGWFLGNLISSTRTAIVQNGQPIEMRERRGGGKLLWRAAPGVVGRLSQCGGGWCRFDVHGQAGWVESDRLWGVEPTETLP